MFDILDQRLIPICEKMLDIMYTKLYEQGRPSLHSDMYCLYRADNGDKCAVGHLIPDDLYQPSMERHSARVTILGHENLLQYMLGDLADDVIIKMSFLDWITEAQGKLHDGLRTQDTIQDENGNSSFRTRLRERTEMFAKKYGLTFKG